MIMKATAKRKGSVAECEAETVSEVKKKKWIYLVVSVLKSQTEEKPAEWKKVTKAIRSSNP